VEYVVIERTKELKDEKEKVDRLLKLKTDFVNQLSHDLRTPLTPLKILLPIIKEQIKDEELLK
jgi:signal transduction histidine kinase